MKTIRRTFAILVALALALSLAACQGGNTSSKTQNTEQQTTEAEGQKQIKAEPYPLAQINDSAERKNLIERLLRLNDPNKIGYLAEFTANGQLIRYITTKGKVSSTGSQLTNIESIVRKNSENSVVTSIGDDGSYGPEECQDVGIVYFDTNDVMHEDCLQGGNWVWSDAPSHFSISPLVIEGTTPTSTAGVTGKKIGH